MNRTADPAGPLRVALLSPCYWPEVRRGGERFTRELADGLLAHGHRPALITSHPGAPRRTIEDGLPVMRLPRPPQGRLLRRGYEPYLTHVPLSYLALRAGSYELTHAIHPPDALAAARWARRTGRPSLLSYMGIPDHSGLCEYRRRLANLKRAIETCDAVVALSRYAADAFRRWLGYEAPVISPGVDLSAFRPVTARSERPTLVCSADPAVPRKNVALLVEAFALVRHQRPDARLLLSLPPEGISAAEAAGVELDVPGLEWVNLDERTALAQAYAEAWVAVLPSVNEAFGLVLVEALACGTPVVGYADGGIPEIIDGPEIGRLFDRLEADVLARTVLEALELAADPATAGRCRARAEDFSVTRCTERYLGLYRQLLERRPLR